MLTGIAVVLAVVAVCCLVVLGLRFVDDYSRAADAPNATPTPTTATPTPTPTSTAPATSPIDALLDSVRIVPTRPNPPGYDRDCGPGDGCAFGPEWSDDTTAPSSHNGCDTRNDVLAQQLDDVAWRPGTHDCDVVAGTIQDPYTDRLLDYATQGSEIHIDHVFPLAAAWDFGASGWTPAERAAFANDTETELLAVDGAANMSKGDSTPSDWLPPNQAFRCDYVLKYLTIADTYDLAITAADARTIEAVSRRC